MPKKGVVNNPNGRPKGSQNKGTKEVRELVNQLLDENFENIQKDVDSLEPIERLKFLVALLPYVLPKQQAINEVTNDPQKIIVEGISTEELNELLGDS